MKKKVCMVVPSFTAKGGITSVVNGYRNSQLTEDYDVRFIETPWVAHQNNLTAMAEEIVLKELVYN